MVEQGAFNSKVLGSSPGRPIILVGKPSVKQKEASNMQVIVFQKDNRDPSLPTKEEFQDALSFTDIHIEGRTRGIPILDMTPVDTKKV